MTNKAKKRGRGRPRNAQAGAFAKWLDASGLTFDEAAKKLKTSSDRLAKWRRGERPSLHRIVQIEKVTGGAVPASSWLKRKAPERPAPKPKEPARLVQMQSPPSLPAKEPAKLVRDFIVSCGPDGCTDDEMEVRTGLSHQTASPRRRELVQRGLVVELRDADGNPIRRATRSGRTASVWVAAPQKQVA